MGRDIGYEGSHRGSQQNSPTKYQDEYDLDESGRKVAMPQHKTGHAREAALAASAAAAVLAGRNRKSAADEIRYENRDESSGAPLHKSFADRTKEVPGQIPSPRHSIDAPLSVAESHEQLKMGASGMPDLNDPMPEIGAWNDAASDVLTNPSVVDGPIAGTPQQNRDHWPAKPTPPRSQFDNHSQKSDANLKAAEAALVGAAIGMGGAAALAHHNHSQEASPIREEEWRRDSAERKRDTLITNPC